MKTKILFAIFFLSMMMISCNSKKESMESDLKKFLLRYDSLAKPLENDMSLTNWEASISGKEEDYAKSETSEKKYSQFHSNKEDFKKLESAIAEQSYLLIEQISHKLYSSFTIMCVTGAAKILKEMEQGAENKMAIADIKEKFISLNEIYAGVKKDLIKLQYY